MRRPCVLIRIAIVTALAVVSPSCSDERQTVTLEEARVVLEEAVRLGLEGDDEALCAMGGSVKMCERHLESARGRRPTEAPREVGHREIPTAGDNTGGVVLEIEGVDGSGKPYRSDFLVFHSGKEPVPLVPVWWAGVSVGSDGSIRARGAGR